jgi:ArsR family transcriptional regulator, virulence genes transcriptional regulator
MSPNPRANGQASPPRGTPAHDQLPERLAESIAEYLHVMAEPHRIALLGALVGGEASVGELADRVGIPYQNTSHHLILLRRAGILSRRKLGKANLYAIEDWSAWWVVGQIADWMCSDPDEQGSPASSE